MTVYTWAASPCALNLFTTLQMCRVFEYGGAKVVTDDLSLQFLSGSIVDFETDLMRSGFVVAGNPNAASSCGCGSSFVAK